VRAKLDELKAQAQENVGFDPIAVREGLASARFQVSWQVVPGFSSTSARNPGSCSSA